MKLSYQGRDEEQHINNKVCMNYTICYMSYWGVRGGVVKVIYFKPLAPHHCGFESRQGLWILSCDEANQLAYGTSVVLLRCPFVPEKMHRGALEVLLHQ
jgi:hypothetical protein